jgi:hypothetical protein
VAAVPGDVSPTPQKKKKYAICLVWVVGSKAGQCMVHKWGVQGKQDFQKVMMVMMPILTSFGAKFPAYLTVVA